MKLILENIINILETTVPEYLESEYYNLADKDNISSVFGEFGSFLLERMLNYPMKDDIINRSFVLLNEMLDSEDMDVVNVVVVEIFETLAGSRKVVDITEKLLNRKGIYWFDKVRKDFVAE